MFAVSPLDKAFAAWAPSWLQFIDDDENKDLFLNGQHFSKKFGEKTKVFSINTNICYDFNWYSWTAFNDPGH